MQQLYTHPHYFKQEGNMETGFFLATLFNLFMNIFYTLIALVVGLIALKVVDSQLLKSLDIQEELKNNNMAVAVFSSTVLLFVALIVSFGLKG
jgi:uncharacterized membrane protein YjfL (UPF0719 family)